MNSHSFYLLLLYYKTGNIAMRKKELFRDHLNSLKSHSLGWIIRIDCRIIRLLSPKKEIEKR